MIKSVQFSSNRNTEIKNNIDVSESNFEEGSITLICGENHSGKTYIIKHINRSIFDRNRKIKENPNNEYFNFSSSNIYVNYTEPKNIISSVYIQRFSLITNHLKSLSMKIKNNHKNRNHFSMSDNYDRIQIKKALEKFCFDCLFEFFQKSNLEIDKEKWIENYEYRNFLLKKIESKKLYLSTRNNEVVKLFEKLTKGKLYFGSNIIKTDQGEIYEFELRLVFNDNIIIPIGAWSEGQKVVFSLLLIIYYIKPEVLIVDEIENHLHPEYISSILSFIKKHIKQTIITTHHPHIIFSKHVDLVNYLEFEKKSDELPEIITQKRSEKMKSMKLSNKLLNKNYNKLLSTYKLFDNYDNQLLRISSTSISDLNEVLIELFTSLFSYEIITPKKIKKPDLQSQKLYEIFAKKIKDNELEILEYGAGEGRLLIDLDKITKITEKNKFNWHLFEPFDEPREKMKKNLKSFKNKLKIQIHSKRPVKKFDFIIIPNVLHELTSIQIADILHYSVNSLKKEGSIVIVELYPLIKPEKYAVPLNQNEWKKLGRGLGFKTYSNGIKFKNSMFEAYFVQLSISEKFNNSNVKKFEKIIRNFWKSEVLIDRIHNYDGHIRFGDVDELPYSLGNLCTISSIIANNKNIWK